MPWRIIDGQPVKVTRGEVAVTLPPPEVEVSTEIEVDLFVCPECGKEYRTERGLENHADTH